MMKTSIPENNMRAVQKDDPSMIDMDALKHTDGKSQTLLFYAVRQQAHKVLSKIIDSVDLDHQNSFGETPIHIAASIGNKDALKTLLKSGCDYTLKNKKGITPLMAAAKKGPIESVQAILLKDIDLTTTDNFGNTVLFYAVQSNAPDILNTLIQQGANPHIINQRRETLHHFAAQYANFTMVKTLEQHKVPLYIPSDYRETPLHHAAKKGKADHVAYYLKRGLSPETHDSFQYRPMDYGRDYGDIDMLFTRFDNAIEMERAMNAHPLSKALRNGRFEVASVLIKEGKTLNDKDPYSNRPVFYTLVYKQKELYEALVEKGSVFSDIDYHGHGVEFYLTLLKLNW